MAPHTERLPFSLWQSFGNTGNMKRLILLLFLGSILATSCTVYHETPSGKLPPGQAKKVYGTKSAKPFAPGQQKKQ